ncbi:MAG: hypothetical protein AB8H86_31820 [Polyangiales bacterium]
MRFVALSVVLLACHSSMTLDDIGSDAAFDVGTDGGTQPDTACVPQSLGIDTLQGHFSARFCSNNGRHVESEYFDVAIYLCEESNVCCATRDGLGLLYGHYSDWSGTELRFQSRALCGERLVLQDVSFVRADAATPSRIVWRLTPELPLAFRAGELILDECVVDSLCE